MTLYAIFPGHNNLSVSVRNGFRAVQDKINEEPVLLRDRQMMTIVAVYLLVFTRFPGIKCGLHQMAADTEFRIILGEVIELE